MRSRSPRKSSGFDSLDGGENVIFLTRGKSKKTVGLHALAGVVSGSKLPHRFF
jgi:hypothetical protein